ncbi:MAG: hypothetical protein ROO76_06200 [Terriglobia bacterium]|nr:hypothetical protein [Terriglobia bacterium]
MNQNASRQLAAIVAAGTLCGCMDISAAFVTWMPRGVSPRIILQGIASALLGPSAFHEGTPTMALGLFLHFFIAFSWATVFYLASRSFPVLTRRPLLFGPLYGILVYLVMYWVVMPLSRFHGASRSIFNTVVAIVTHIFCVGLPIAFMVSRYSNRAQRKLTLRASS